MDASIGIHYWSLTTTFTNDLCQRTHSNRRQVCAFGWCHGLQSDIGPLELEVHKKCSHVHREVGACVKVNPYVVHFMKPPSHYEFLCCLCMLCVHTSADICSKWVVPNAVKWTSSNPPFRNPLGDCVGASWRLLSASWGPWDASWEALGRLLEASKRHLGPKPVIAKIFIGF